jgi:hypothetical protein
MWSDLAPAAAGARSDRKWLHITAARRRDAERLSNDPYPSVVSGSFLALNPSDTPLSSG